MPASDDELIFTNLLGLTGMLISLSVSLSGLKSVREAREMGSLGGLDSRSWPLFATVAFLWTSYAVRLGDIWLFLASFPSAVIWLYFCNTAIRLLSQENGEQAPTSADPTESIGVGPIRNHGVAPIRKKSVGRFRNKAMEEIEKGLAAGFGFTLCLTFACSPWNTAKLSVLEEWITPEIKLSVFSSIAGCFSLSMYIKPVSRLWLLTKRRDASTIFLPLVMTQLFKNLVWGTYGLLVLDPGLYVPYACAVFVCLAQLLLKCVFREVGAAVEDSALKEEPGMSMHSVIPISNEKSVIQVTTRREVTSMASSACDTSSSIVAAESHVVSDAANATKSGGSPSSPSEVAAAGRAQSGIGLIPSRPRRHSMPDLNFGKGSASSSGSVYEDYLKWQVEYRKQQSEQKSKWQVIKEKRQAPMAVISRFVEVSSKPAIPGEVHVEEC
ncbi:unnamed protein product [Polarella glacialis]|uniref:Uncharacterized protein n=1 Tax=Polarella glacialis TaxID=89957 RepID=A0A813L1Y7_POLGL|nr:unnamed protein product [Polarella glacialis]|mmetsp:Transcript_65168/g.117241  ORF Transcript_65168/g.117241 Transcript_65168/m.117241 type:complete len:440 (-) Transcript_65168:90-1409(-)